MLRKWTTLLLSLCLLFICPVQSFAASEESVMVQAEEEAAGDEGGGEAEAGEEPAPEPEPEPEPQPEPPAQTEAPQTEAPAETEAPQTEAPAETEAPADTEAPQTEAPGETLAETEAPADTEAPAQTVQESVPETETAAETEPQTEAALSTSVEGVRLRSPGPTTLRIFVGAKRMKQVPQERLYAVRDLDIFEEPEANSRVVGTLARDGVCYRLEEVDETWLFVESGDVRGFAGVSDLKEAHPLVADGLRADEAEGQLPAEMRFSSGLDLPERVASHAEAVLTKEENAAYLYTMTTTQHVIADKRYALAKEDIAIYETCPAEDDAAEGGAAAGSLPREGLCFILADDGGEWVFAESGNVRGYVRRNDIETGDSVDAMIGQRGEASFALAEAVGDRDEQAGFIPSFRSVYPAIPEGFEEDSIVSLLKNAVGRETDVYCTSPDAFAGEIYGAYGYNIGDTIEAYQDAGQAVGDPRPGDLILFDMAGDAEAEDAEEDADALPACAGIYLGEGRIVYAAEDAVHMLKTEEADISGVRSVLSRTYELPASTDIHEKNAPEENYGKYLGTFKLTYYCPCAQCCDVATGLTATGVLAAEGETIAVDPTVIPYGTKVIVNGHIFIAQDCGGAIKGNRIDIFVSEHGKTYQSIETGEVYVLNN